MRIEAGLSRPRLAGRRPGQCGGGVGRTGRQSRGELEAGYAHAGDPRVYRLVGQRAAASRRDGPRDREPAADLMRSVACQLDLLIRQVQQVVELAAFKLAEEPAIELLVDVANPRHADEMRQAARAGHRDTVQPVV